MGNGQAVFTLDATNGGSIIAGVNSTSTVLFNHAAAGNSALIRGTNLGLYAPGTNGSVSLVASGALTFATTGNQTAGQLATSGFNMLIYPWAVADTSPTGNGIGFATYGGTNGVRPLNFATDGVTGALTTNDNVQLLNGTVSTTGGNGIYSINSLTLNGSGGNSFATVNAGSTIQLQSGGLLALNGTSTISGAAP